jgi:hypothetical protein
LKVHRAEVASQTSHMGVRLTVYQVTFETLPDNGIYEGRFAIRGNSPIVEPSWEFSRLNEYGVQPCKPKPWVRIFCKCKEDTEA